MRTVHPSVRRNTAVAEVMIAKINEALSADGYELYADGEISGRKIYGARRIDSFHGDRPAVLTRDEATLGDRHTLDRHLRRIERRLGDYPEAAIGSCKELVESVLMPAAWRIRVVTTCRPYSKLSLHIIIPGDFHEHVDEPGSRALDFRSDSVPKDAKASEAVVGLLRGLSASVQSLAELRNSAGTGHGRSTKAAVEKRHARLALNAAVAVTEFLFSSCVGSGRILSSLFQGGF